MSTVPSKELLLHLYEDEKLTQKEIAEWLAHTAPYNQDPSAWYRERVYYYFRKYHIQSQWAQSRKSRGDIGQLSEEEYQIIIGSLLGDGTIETAPMGHPRFREMHSSKQYAYITWKHDQLRRLCTGGLYERAFPHSKTKKIVKVYRLTTIRLEFFEEIHQIFYPNGKKRVPPDEFLSQYDPLALAVWYMDDGHLGSSGSLATFGFSKEGTERLINFFNKKYDFGFRLWNQRNKIFQIGIPVNSPFYVAIAPFVIPSMQYKLPTYLRSLPATEGNEIG